MKISHEITIDPEQLAGGLRNLPAKDSHAFVEGFLAGLDTDAYVYAQQWIQDNPVESVECPRCKRQTFSLPKQARPGSRRECEYCKAVLP